MLPKGQVSKRLDWQYQVEHIWDKGPEKIKVHGITRPNVFANFVMSVGSWNREIGKSDLKFGKGKKENDILTMKRKVYTEEAMNHVKDFLKNCTEYTDSDGVLRRGFEDKLEVFRNIRNALCSEEEGKGLTKLFAGNWIKNDKLE